MSTSSADDNNKESKQDLMMDSAYPGTAIQRMLAVRKRVADLNEEGAFTNKPWEEIRQKLLWAGGLKDLQNVPPGQGYTGHAFNDFNHVDLATMLDGVQYNTNDGKVKGIAVGNRLGPGIRIASDESLGPGGSWSTCALGCHIDPPQDVAHLQFESRIAFKLVWVPNENYDKFVLVDDDGELLAVGTPLDDGLMPPRRERMVNYKTMANSKYASAADHESQVSVE